jgi:hypothetical protein
MKKLLQSLVRQSFRTLKSLIFYFIFFAGHFFELEAPKFIKFYDFIDHFDDFLRRQ